MKGKNCQRFETHRRTTWHAWFRRCVDCGKIVDPSGAIRQRAFLCRSCDRKATLAAATSAGPAASVRSIRGI